MKRVSLRRRFLAGATIGSLAVFSAFAGYGGCTGPCCAPSPMAASGCVLGGHADPCCASPEPSASRIAGACCESGCLGKAPPFADRATPRLILDVPEHAALLVPPQSPLPPAAASLLPWREAPLPPAGSLSSPPCTRGPPAR